MKTKVVIKTVTKKPSNPLNTIYIGTILKKFFVRERKNQKYYIDGFQFIDSG